MLKSNFGHLLCSRVGISVTEEEEEDMWLVCYERFLSSKETLPIESPVEFIFSRCEELDFPKEVYNFIVEIPMYSTAKMEVMKEVPTKEFMQNLVLSLQRLKEQGKAIPFSKYPDFSQMGGKFSAPLASLQRAIDKAKHILDFTV